MTNERSKQWQQNIQGKRYGNPSVFDAHGTHVGTDHVVGSTSTDDSGKTRFMMESTMNITGPLRYRLDVQHFDFQIANEGKNRIYLGPDFYGSGRPFDTLITSFYYSPAYRAHLDTLVHIIPGGYQAYSSLLYEGPALLGCFNGLYKMATDYDTNPETQAAVDAWVEKERTGGARPYALPAKAETTWTGEMHVYNDDQQEVGVNHVEIRYTPLNSLRAEMIVTISGVFEKTFRYIRQRTDSTHTFEGPELFGNGKAFGRALFFTGHFPGQAERIEGREFILDEAYGLSAVWKFYDSGKMRYITYGVLNRA